MWSPSVALVLLKMATGSRPPKPSLPPTSGSTPPARLYRLPCAFHGGVQRLQLRPQPAVKPNALRRLAARRSQQAAVWCHLACEAAAGWEVQYMGCSTWGAVHGCSTWGATGAAIGTGSAREQHSTAQHRVAQHARGAAQH